MWLRLKQGETVNACISFGSVKSVAKHWTGYRSEPCMGEGCAHCLKGVPKRWRYQATLLVGSDSVEWEFGEQSMGELKDLPREHGWAHISITRLGEGRSTRYRVSPQGDGTPQPSEAAGPAEARQTPSAASKYLRGKYGHLVRTQVSDFAGRNDR